MLYFLMSGFREENAYQAWFLQDSSRSDTRNGVSKMYGNSNNTTIFTKSNSYLGSANEHEIRKIITLMKDNKELQRTTDWADTKYHTLLIMTYH
jgi:hypothetical protein